MITRNTIITALGLGMLLAGCNATEGGDEGLTENEKAIVGTWLGIIGPASVTMTLKADHTHNNLTLLDSKPYWKSEGTWSVSGDLVTMANAKCQMADASGALKDTPCSGTSASDTTRIKVAGNKWTVNSTGSNHQDVVFTKQ